MPDEFDERLGIVVHLCPLDGPEERNALVAADRDPGAARAEQRIVHEQSAQTTVSVHEGMDGYELEVHEQSSSDRLDILARGKALEPTDEIRNLLRVRGHVAPTAQADTR